MFYVFSGLRFICGHLHLYFPVLDHSSVPLCICYPSRNQMRTEKDFDVDETLIVSGFMLKTVQVLSIG